MAGIGKAINEGWLAGRSLLDLIAQGYPESVSQRIISGELDMREPARSAREKAFGYPSYHSTRSDWSQVDPDTVDIGLHSGTTEQADMRLRDTATDYKFAGRGRDAKDFPYGEGAQVMPLVIRANNPLEMSDVGQWENAQAVAESLLFHPKFTSNRGELEDIYSQMDEVLQSVDGDDIYERYVDIPENRSFLDDISAMIQDKGYDSVKYENTVENAFGSSSNYKPEVKAIADNLNMQIKQLEASLSNSPDRPKLPTQADLRGMAPDEVTKALDAYLSWDSPKSSELESLKAKLFEIRDNPDSYMDTHSYISLKPENVRSKYAAFDPEYTGSNILGSRVLPIPNLQEQNAQLELDNLMGQYNQFMDRKPDIYNYGDFAPVKRNVVSGDYSLAVPTMVDDIVKGLLDIGQSRKTGVVNSSTSLLDALL